MAKFQYPEDQNMIRISLHKVSGWLVFASICRSRRRNPLGLRYSASKSGYSQGLRQNRYRRAVICFFKLVHPAIVWFQISSVVHRILTSPLHLALRIPVDGYSSFPSPPAGTGLSRFTGFRSRQLNDHCGDQVLVPHNSLRLNQMAMAPTSGTPYPRWSRARVT